MVSALACGSGPGTATSPVPRPEAGPATPGAAASEARISYHITSALDYEVSRYDSIIFQGIGSGAPQVTGRRVHLSIRPDGGNLAITVDSVAGVLGQPLASTSLDSARQARFEVRLSSNGLNDLRTNRSTVLVGQIAASIRLLFPRLPSRGVTSGDLWSDSSAYSIRLDAFDATETAARESQAKLRGAGGVRVEGVDRLTRRGKADQGGRSMTISGSGRRQVTYDLAPEGWVSFLLARDSLALEVAVPDSPAPIPVLWRSTIIARLRGDASG
jgi:hypothetical protein